MSAAWDRFERQLHTTGREKADGYSAAHFEGLTAEERARAFDLLRQEARVDPTVAEWLFHLDPTRAEAACLDLIDQERGDPQFPAFVVERALCEHTGDLRYQQRMIDRYPGLPADQKLRALEHLGRTPATTPLRRHLEGVLLHETDQDLLASAAYHLLRAHGQPYTTDADKARFRDLLVRLSDPSLPTRQQTLRTLAP